MESEEECEKNLLQIYLFRTAMLLLAILLTLKAFRFLIAVVTTKTTLAQIIEFYYFMKLP